MRRAGTTFPGGLFQRTGVAGGLRIRRYLPEAVIVLGALYCAGLPIYGVTTISFTSALYIALAVVLALALMLPRPARTHLALVVVSFGTALLLAEVYFSATDRSPLEIRLNSGTKRCDASSLLPIVACRARTFGRAAVVQPQQPPQHGLVVQAVVGTSVQVPSQNRVG